MTSLRALLNRPEAGLSLALIAVVLVTALVDQQHNYWMKPGPSIIDILRQAALSLVSC